MTESKAGDTATSIVSTSSTENNTLLDVADKLGGMVLATLVGDALGMQFEFDSSLTYHDKLEYKLSVFYRRTHKRSYGIIGQYSDDSEMTLILIRRLIADQGYNTKHVTLDYMQWANDSKFLGRNTRALFKGVKTIEGYTSRYKGVFKSQQLVDDNQSNGPLMRCSGLVILPDSIREQVVITDCSLTNPSKVNVCTNLSYIRCMRYMLEGKSVDQAIELTLQAKDMIAEVKSVILDALDAGKSRDLSGKGKGWCLHALYAAFHCLKFAPSYMAAMHWICVQKYTDTDTLAAIAGAMLGIRFGYQKLLQEPGLPEIMSTVLCVDTKQGEFPRDERWLLRGPQLVPLVQAMQALYLGQASTQVVSVPRVRFVVLKYEDMKI